MRRCSRGAAARAEPVFATTTAEARDDDAFAKLHGLFWLLSDLAQRRPVVLLFDDAQWSDEPSVHFLAFLAPRLADVPVAVVVELRELIGAELICLAQVSESTRRDLRPRLDALEEPEPGATGWLAACTWAELALRAATEGTSARRAVEYGARAIPVLAGRAEPPADWIRLVTTTSSIWCEAFDQSERLVALAIDDARRRGTAAPLSGAASLRAWLNLRRGRLADAESECPGAKPRRWRYATSATAPARGSWPESRSSSRGGSG